MSSTSRGGIRQASDYYLTPLPPIRDFFGAWFEDLDMEPRDGFNPADRPDRAAWLDPAAGGDATHPMAYPTVIREEFDPIVLDTMDIREDSGAFTKGDYLKTEVAKGFYDIIITNPPFGLAEEFIRKA